MMLKLDNNEQSFIYVAAFEQRGQKLHPYAHIQAKPSISKPYRSATFGDEVIDNAFCK